jgi:hypothetical protein
VCALYDFQGNKGYFKSGQKCIQIAIPAYASLNQFGNGWECNLGYRKVGEICEKIIVPSNAHLTPKSRYSFAKIGKGWDCNKGFYQKNNTCLEIEIPKNGQLNAYGNNWICIKGFKKQENTCVKMTPEELKVLEKIELERARAIQRQRMQGVSGDHCEIEYKTNAEVCISITGGDLNCNESYDGNYYQDCDVDLNYEVSTDYKGGSYIDAEINCTVEIEYEDRESYRVQTDSNYENETHSLYAHGSDSNNMSFNFSFSSYEEIIKAKISSAECEIESVNLW